AWVYSLNQKQGGKLPSRPHAGSRSPASGNSAMTNESGCRRILIAAEAAEQAPLEDLFAKELLANWQASTVHSFERAHFLLQHDPCAVFLVDERFVVREPPGALAWLDSKTEAPVVMLSTTAAEFVTAALECGLSQWLPRQLVLNHPPLLAAALRQAKRWNELH